MVHCHIEIAKGKYEGKWYANKYGVYCLYNSIPFYDAFFMDNVELINVRPDVAAKFKYLEKCDCEDLKKQIATLTEELVLANKKIEQLEIENLKLEEKLTISNEKLIQVREIVK